MPTLATAEFGRMRLVAIDASLANATLGDREQVVREPVDADPPCTVGPDGHAGTPREAAPEELVVGQKLTPPSDAGC